MEHVCVDLFQHMFAPQSFNAVPDSCHLDKKEMIEESS